MSPTHFCKEDRSVIMALIQFHVEKLSKVLFLCFMINPDVAVRNELRATYTTDCICPGQNATFECTVVGGDFTLWNGSFIESSECEIVLQHYQFLSRIASCNFGAETVVGQSIEINGSCYTSKLTVPVTSNLDGKDVSCSVDYGFGANTTIIGTEIINISTVPPSNVQLDAANPTELIFSWNPPSVSCPSLTYTVEAQNCGICPNSTTTNTTCTNFNLSTVCLMSIYSVTCGNSRSRNSSNVVQVNLTVPEIPGDIKIEPHYSDRDSRLLSVKTQFHTWEQYSISNGIDGSATNYTITYFDLKSGSSCNSATIQCQNKTCNHMLEICSSTCPPVSDISVKVAATNVLGQGPAKISSAFANGTNSYVDVTFLSSTRRLTCTFLNQNQGTPNDCKITISYGDNCSQLLGTYNMKTPPIETIIINDVTEYCFSAAAYSVSTLNQTVVIEGTLNLISTCDRENGGYRTSTIVLGILTVLGIGTTIILIIIVVLYIIRMKNNIAFEFAE